MEDGVRLHRVPDSLGGGGGGAPIDPETPLDDMDRSVLFVNRELSWLAFNRRVLAEALDPTVPLLERLKFLAIASTNLDEFFEIRVAGVMELVEANLSGENPDGIGSSEELRLVRQEARKVIDAMHVAWQSHLVPELQEQGIKFRTARELTKAHESIYRGTLGQLAARAASEQNFARGELTVVVQGAPAGAAVRLTAATRRRVRCPPGRSRSS